ncbi:MAG TPA: GtrA family protein [Enterococcus columbae]|nr:GtrA family protein [Enterococcus columbae]
MRLVVQLKDYLEEKKLWEIFSYLFFGGLTFLVNCVTYFLFLRVFGMNYLISNLISWIISVLFAYITNKLWVFQTRNKTYSETLKELFLFFAARIITLGLDMGSLSFCLEILKTNNIIAKFVSQFIVIVSNYAFSKLVIFKKS